MMRTLYTLHGQLLAAGGLEDAEEKVTSVIGTAGKVIAAVGLALALIFMTIIGIQVMAKKDASESFREAAKGVSKVLLGVVIIGCAATLIGWFMFDVLA